MQRIDISVSAGHDDAAVLEAARRLVQDGGRWQLCNGGAGLERHFKFKSFKSTWAFMNDVAEECKKQKHHPEWTNVFNRTHIRWTTHSPKGMSTKDTLMASCCDEAAARHDEQWPDPQGVAMEGGRVKNAEDCGCGQKGT